MWLVPGHTEVSSKVKNWIFLSHDLVSLFYSRGHRGHLSMSELSTTSQKKNPNQTFLLVSHISLLAEISMSATAEVHEAHRFTGYFLWLVSQKM